MNLVRILLCHHEITSYFYSLKMLVAFGKFLLRLVLSVLLKRCEGLGVPALEYRLAQEFQQLEDHFYKNKKYRHNLLSRHYLTNVIPLMDDVQHRAAFRMTRDQFNKILTYVSPHPVFAVGSRATHAHALSVRQKLYIALYHKATGDSFHSVGRQFGVSPPTVMCCVYDVATAINDTMVQKYLNDLLPTTESMRRAYAYAFWKKSGVPNIIGAVDVSHVHIQAPPSNEYDPTMFRGRDGKPSVCLQVRSQCFGSKFGWLGMSGHRSWSCHCDETSSSLALRVDACRLL
jgi:hypothetical protein